MRLATFAAVALVCASTPLHAQSPFDGTWRFGPEATHVSGIRYDISLQNGAFTCRWCNPVWSVPADGMFHPVKGQSRYDAASVRIVDASTAVFTRKKNGRAFYQAVDVVSEDENYMAFSFTEISAAGKIESGTGLWKRLTPKPVGAHPVTGQWRELWVKATSDDQASFAIRIMGDDLRIEYAPTEVVVAKFGGPPVKIEGDSRGTTTTFRRQGEDAFVQTDYRDGQVASIVTSKLLNPVTMEVIVENTRDGSRSRYTAHKQ
ncbi:hypothetical protein G7076_04945 [Sphingomonas sp. HDW15A]|uniref:hypothetical protein n=1 Tax=Sphingomonas sp. HDW15A TaxID=2714942 RepID=UPI00140D045F|nr:hypothetical protein [Sphingomonas sp. HDW15A]QIK95901.1 hypothetical protein G7076_04945 [Sphingomonas sp. HDW15A]